MNLRSLLTVCILVYGLSPSAISQELKLGHVNYGNLLESLPKVQEAQSVHQAYQDSLTSALKQAYADHQASIQQYQDRYQAGELTAKEAEAVNKSLNETEQSLANEQSLIQTKLLIKRRQLMQPVLDQLQSTIQTYGQSNGFTYIFDEAAGYILFDRPSEDLTDIIKALLAQ